MKKIWIELMLGVTLSVTALSGCGSKGSSEDAGTTIYGQVSEIGEDTITIQVGTQAEMEKPKDAAAEAKDSGKETVTEDGAEEKNGAESMPENMSQGGGQPVSLELTGEVKEIEITEETVIQRQGMSGQPGNMGQQPSGGMDGQGMERPDGEDFAEMMEKPDGEDSGETPEKPDGENSGETMKKPDDENAGEMRERPDGASSGEMMEKPDGEDSGQMPEMSEGDNVQEIELTDISEGDIVIITFDEKGNAEEITVMSMGMGQMGSGEQMQSGGVENYDAAEEYTADAKESGKTIASTGTDENAVHIFEGAEVSLSDMTITRESADSTGGDNSSFYGVGAAVLNTEGTAYISNSTIESDAAGGAGIFSYGDGITYVADTKITTQQDTAGGIHVAGGGTLYAWDMDIETFGESSAAIRSDRGSGTMVADGGTYVSNGVGSPAIYSTADIAVNGADLTAKGSEAACIEGLNSIHLYDSNLSGNMADHEQNDCTWNVILYQSMSGDSEVGNSTFEMSGGSLTANNGGMFYTTNTESTFILSGVEIKNAEDSEFFLKCTGNQNQRGWGSAGDNGAVCLFTAIDQEMQGDVIWDSISELNFYMTEGSSLTGAVKDDESCAGDGGEGYCNLYIAEGCVWTVTEDSVLTDLSGAGTIQDSDGNLVTVQGADGTVYVEGSSNLTVTVESYAKTADLSGASQMTEWSEHAAEKPSQLQ